MDHFGNYLLHRAEFYQIKPVNCDFIREDYFQLNMKMLFLEYSTDLAVAEHLEQDQQSQSVSLLLGLSQHCQENRHFYHNIETKTFKTETTSLLSPIDSDYIPLFIIII